MLQVIPDRDRITILARPRQASSCCPTCATPSHRVHSRYQRTLADLPWQGRPVTLRVQVRRFVCSEARCSRRTFSECLPDVVRPSARRSARLADIQRHLGLALGGEAGARLARRLSMSTSADTLLRLAGATGSAERAAAAPRVLGIDEWAWRRGRRYGTILVDLERNRVVDLLPDRRADTVAAWLRDHPGVEVVARDRADVYEDGVREGAPDAVHVLDRWHLLRNLSEAVQVIVGRHHAAIRTVARQVVSELAAAAHANHIAAVKPTAAQIRSRQTHTHRHARYDEAARLHAAGASISSIARSVGVDRKTVKGWLRNGGPPSWQKPPRPTVLDRYRSYLEQRWREGCRNAAALWRELASLGFEGRSRVVRAWATEQRRRPAIPDNRDADVPAGVIWKPPSITRATRLVQADPATLADPDRAFTERLLAHVDGLGEEIELANRLGLILRKESKEDLDDWLNATEGTALATFATGLRKDLDGVKAALALPWTTGPVEGQINRLKMVKRTMYGRAGFQLLRHRVLEAA